MYWSDESFSLFGSSVQANRQWIFCLFSKKMLYPLSLLIKDIPMCNASESKIYLNRMLLTKICLILFFRVLASFLPSSLQSMSTCFTKKGRLDQLTKLEDKLKFRWNIPSISILLIKDNYSKQEARFSRPLSLDCALKVISQRFDWTWLSREGILCGLHGNNTCRASKILKFCKLYLWPFS